MEPERVTARQIEAARRALTRHMKRAGRVWIRVFPDVPVSKKPLEVRMGSGKGTPEYWVARVKPGRVLFEIDGVPVQTAKEALALAPPSCRSRRASSRASRSRRDGQMKVEDIRGDDADQLADELPESEEGAVQPALPARHRAAGEHLAACAKSAATSPASRPSPRRSARPRRK